MRRAARRTPALACTARSRKWRKRSAAQGVQVAYANADESAGNWILRAYYDDANHNGLGYTSVAMASSASTILV